MIAVQAPSLSDLFEKMEPRHLRVVEYVSHGLTDAAIAQRTNLAISSVRVYISQCSRLLGLARLNTVRERRNEMTRLYQEWERKEGGSTKSSACNGNGNVDDGSDMNFQDAMVIDGDPSMSIQLYDPDSIDGPPNFIVLGSPDADAEHKRLRRLGYLPEIVTKHHHPEHDVIVMTAIYIKRK